LVAHAKEELNMKVEVDVIRPATPSAADLKRKKLSYFIVANLIAVVLGVGIFWAFMAVPEGTGFDTVMGAIWRFLKRHETVAVLAASLPFFASLLVGQFEMRKARAKRARKEAEEKRDRMALEIAAQEAERQKRRASA
jgi:hypothetical protein